MHGVSVGSVYLQGPFRASTQTGFILSYGAKTNKLTQKIQRIFEANSEDSNKSTDTFAHLASPLTTELPCADVHTKTICFFNNFYIP